MYSRKFIIVGILVLLLVACGGTNEAVVPADSGNNAGGENVVAEEPDAENDVADLPVATAAESAPVELPPIPPVTFAEKNAWFTPTPVENIQLASGKVQVFDFSAIWCTYCRQMAPVLEGLEILYGEEANFVMLDLDLDDVYGVYIDKLGYDPRFRPGIYVLDPEGNILNFWLGPVDGTIIQEALVSALAKYP